MEIKTKQRAKYWFWNRQYYVVPIIPIIFCWLPIVVNNPIGYTAYTIIIMAFFWCLEIIPLAATSLLPMVLFPLFGVLKSDDVCRQYLKDTNVLFFGGLMVAIAIERWNLHRRIALKVLLVVGTKPVWLMFGFMSTTAFLSMWMSNTATTAMMIPIANAVLTQLADNPGEAVDETAEIEENDATHEAVTVENGQENLGFQDSPDTDIEGKFEKDKDLEIVIAPQSEHSLQEERKLQYQRMCKGITLCVPYAANIGGTATVTGTGPNLVLINQIDSLYGPEANVSFGTWMMLAFPGMLICLFLCWLWLQFVFLDSFKFWKQKLAQTKEQSIRARKVIQGQYDALGPMSFAEKAVLVHFVILIALWLTRDPKFVDGWAVIFKSGFVTDSTTVIAVCMFLFCFPSEPLGFMCRRVPEEIPRTREDKAVHKQEKTIPPLLNWRIVEQKMAWSVIFLLGGGAAMAEACKASGLSSWLGEQLAVFGSLSPGVMTLLISFIVAAFTEITSNTATATIFLPIFAELATSLGVNPLYIMIPATLACSYAFMLPVATPPNAIAFSHGTISVMDMARTGFILNIVCVLVANFTINTFGTWIFDVKSYPDWADPLVTTVAPTSSVINCTEYLQNMLTSGPN